MSKSKKLIFIYNANSGLVNSGIDYLHKIISPKTYNCNLCALTYDKFGMLKKWKNFINSSPISIKFIYKNNETYSRLIKSNDKLPAVWLELDGNPSILITADQINQEKTFEGLVKLVRSKIY
jgi:hypothetical protein